MMLCLSRMTNVIVRKPWRNALRALTATFSLSACAGPTELPVREASSEVSLMLTDEDAVDRYTCKFYRVGDVWQLVCYAGNGGGSTHTLATVTVTANTSAIAGTAVLGYRPYDSSRRFDTDPQSPIAGFTGAGWPSDIWVAPDLSEPLDGNQRRIADSVFASSGLASRGPQEVLSLAELKACSRKPVTCGVILHIRNDSYDLAALAAKQDLGGLVNGQRDAYRHFIGQFLAATHLSKDEAKFWGDLHEHSHWRGDFSNYMDLWNNEIARSYADGFLFGAFNPGYRLAQTLATQADRCHQLSYDGAGLVDQWSRPNPLNGPPLDGYACQ
jgi:hypothetical protein